MNGFLAVQKEIDGYILTKDAGQPGPAQVLFTPYPVADYKVCAPSYPQGTSCLRLPCCSKTTLQTTSEISSVSCAVASTDLLDRNVPCNCLHVAFLSNGTQSRRGEGA